jgi:hypothetical protein
MAVSLQAKDVESMAFWRGLRPELTIESGEAREKFEVPGLADLMARLRFEGYLNVPGVVPPEFFSALHACTKCLHERGIPLPFAFVYDEFWQLFQRLSGFLETVLGAGYRALPDFWVWYVQPSEESKGWAPHRDRVQATVDRNNSPHSLTVWVPFTDATPLNGCIHVLPAHLDERFKQRFWDGEGNTFVSELQNVRALPATAGSLLAWNQNVLHWGGRASRMAPGPRSSAAFEFQRGDRTPFNTPLLDPRQLPPFQKRLGLVGKQVLQYKHMYPLAPEIAAIAETLRGKYMPGAAVTG